MDRLGNRHIFQRKPATEAHCIQKQNRTLERSRNKSRLGLDKHVVSISIKEENKNDEMLSSPLWSEENTPCRYSRPLQSVQMVNIYQPMVKLEYSPSIASTAQRQPLDESDLLLDESFHITDTRKNQWQTATSRVNSQLQFSNNSPSKCSMFNISQLTDTFRGCLRLSLLSISSYTFKIDYRPHPPTSLASLLLEEQPIFKEDPLINRMKRFFIKHPLHLFQLYQELSKGQQFTLRLFLMERGVKYYTQEIQNVEKKVKKFLEGQTVGETLQLMFFTRDYEDLFILNLEGHPSCEHIDLSNKNFWISLAPPLSSLPLSPSHPLSAFLVSLLS